MKPSLLSRSVHKWLALFVGLQLLVWAVTGFYMVAVDLDFIHGDPLVRNLRAPVGNTRSVLPVAQVASRYPEISLISLHSLPVLNTPVYELTAAGRRVLLDATNGQQLSPLSSGMIRQLARSYYAGNGQLSAVQLHCEDARRRCGVPISTIGWRRRSICIPIPARWSRSAIDCGVGTISSGCCTSWITACARRRLVSCRASSQCLAR
jgi:hypothetical protein